MEKYRLRSYTLDVVRYTQEMHDRLLAIDWPENGVYKIDPGLVGGVEGLEWASNHKVALYIKASPALVFSVGDLVVRGNELTEGKWIPMTQEILDKMYERIDEEVAVGEV